MNKKIMNKKIAAALIGVGLFGASIGVAQTAFAQEAPATGPDAVAAAFQDAEGNAPDGQAPDGEARPEGRRGRHGRGCHLEIAAEAIGISVDELRAGLQAGQTVAQVAEANGVSTNAVVEALIEQATARIDTKVDEGRITAEEGATKLAEKVARIQDQVFSVHLFSRGGADGPQA